MKADISIAAVVPAAGHASRIQPLPCSKEIYPIGYQLNRETGISEPVVVASNLLLHLSEAGVKETYFIIRSGKWDIPRYFGNGSKQRGLHIAYIVTEPTPGTPFTVDQVYPFVRNKIILFGFPDIIIKVHNPFTALLKKLDTTGSDIVLGLFDTDQPGKADMVETDDQGRLMNIVIKPEKTGLKRTWLMGVWKPSFTDFLHHVVARQNNNTPETEPYTEIRKEIYMGDIIREATHKGFIVDTVHFPDAEFLDIGTRSDLEKLFRSDF
jgi:glucose-1-phosphate thymidylyltransferase